MKLSLSIATLFSLGLLVLQGCAQTAIRRPTSSEGDAPNAIRTLFTTEAEKVQFGQLSPADSAKEFLAQAVTKLTA